MKELLLKGTNGALLKVCDTPTKYELVSCWNYDEETMSWGRDTTSHYGMMISQKKIKQSFSKRLKLTL